MTIKKNQPDRLSDRMRQVVAHAPPAPSAAGKSHPPSKPRPARAEKFKRAVVVLPNGRHFDVILKNLSVSGARVDFYSGCSGLSGQVVLLEPSLGLKKRARVVWKDSYSAGLAFEED